jgi:hypothetical protein
MAAVIEHRDIGGTRRAGKADSGVLHADLIEIGAKDDIEAAALQRCRHVFGIVRRVGQMRRMEIGAIADHQRDAGVGERAGICQRPRRDAENQSPEPAHRPSPPFAGWRKFIRRAAGIPAAWHQHGRRCP